MNAIQSICLPKSVSNSKLSIFIGPPKTGTTSVNNAILKTIKSKRYKGSMLWPLVSVNKIDGSKVNADFNSPNFRLASGSNLNDIAKQLCADPLRLLVNPVKSRGVSILSSEYYFNHLDSLQYLVDHCRNHFSSIEIVFINRNIRSLIISNVIQCSKVLLNNANSSHGHNDRVNVIKERLLALISCDGNLAFGGRFSEQGILQFQEFCNANDRLVFKCLNYDRSSDITEDFFKKILGIDVTEKFERVNKSSSINSHLSRYLESFVDEYRSSNVLPDDHSCHLDIVAQHLKLDEVKQAIGYLLDIPERKRTVLHRADQFNAVIDSTPNIVKVN